MSILKPLKLTSATRNVTLTPEQVLRGKLVSYLNEQKALAEPPAGYHWRFHREVAKPPR